MRDDLTAPKLIALMVFIFGVLVGGLYAGYNAFIEGTKTNSSDAVTDPSSASPQPNQTINRSQANPSSETSRSSEAGIDADGVPADEPSNQTDTGNNTVYTARFVDLTRKEKNITGSIQVDEDVNVSQKKGSVNLTIRSTDSERLASKTATVSEEVTKFNFQELPEQPLIVEAVFSWNSTQYNFVSRELK